jgi:hypothetical protein
MGVYFDFTIPAFTFDNVGNFDLNYSSIGTVNKFKRILSTAQVQNLNIYINKENQMVELH